MPRKRIKPNTTFVGSKLTISANARPQLSEGQCARLERIAGLPEVVLPDVKAIAARFVALASHPPPSNAQVCARLRRLKTRIENLRKELWEIDAYDGYTTYLLSSNYAKIILNQPDAKHFHNMLRITSIELQHLAGTVELTNALITRTSSKRTESSAVANEVRAAFQKFGVPFSIEKSSPAVLTALEILRMFRATTTHAAARQAVFRAMRPLQRARRRAKSGAVTDGDKKNLPVVTRI